jgi:hypothetical protein
VSGALVYGLHAVRAVLARRLTHRMVASMSGSRDDVVEGRAVDIENDRLPGGPR